VIVSAGLKFSIKCHETVVFRAFVLL